MKRRISVIISGMPSVGKTTAAEAVSRVFRLAHLAGGDMLKQMAIERGYRPGNSEWWDTKDGLKFLAERQRNSDFDKEVDRRLVKRIDLGGVVVTSYPLPWICKKGLKLWLAASQKSRARRLAGRDSIKVSAALSIVKKRDVQNRNLYRKLYGIEFGTDLEVFNYCIDTEKLNGAEVSDLCVQLVRNYAGQTGKSRAF